MNFEPLISNVSNSPYGAVIKNKQFMNYLTRIIAHHYNVKGNEPLFPAPQPVSMEKKDFEKLEKYEYTVSLKMDGTRFLMYFLKDKNDKNQCILVNRAFQFYSINIEAEDNIFNESLFDGEVIFDSELNKWKYLIHDALVLCGNKVSKLHHSIRLQDAQCCIESFIQCLDTNTLVVEVKQFYNFNVDFIEKIYKEAKVCDGIIFMPEKLPVISGTQYSMLKWKPRDKHTFDFQVNENDTGLCISVFHMGNIIPFAKVYKDEEKGKQFIDKFNSLNDVSENCILECTFNLKENNFEPLLIRTDKNHPNSLRTVERTLFNINENITTDDLLNIKFNSKAE